MAVSAGVMSILLMRRVDSVIRKIYATDRNRWQELGRPTGFFWRPEEKVPFVQSVGARNAIMVSAIVSPGELYGPRKNKDTV